MGYEPNQDSGCDAEECYADAYELGAVAESLEMDARIVVRRVVQAKTHHYAFDNGAGSHKAKWRAGISAHNIHIAMHRWDVLRLHFNVIAAKYLIDKETDDTSSPASLGTDKLQGFVVNMCLPRVHPPLLFAASVLLTVPAAIEQCLAMRGRADLMSLLQTETEALNKIARSPSLALILARVANMPGVPATGA